MLGKCKHRFLLFDHLCERVKFAKYFITDRSNAVVLLWFYVACFGVRVSVTFHLMCVHIILVQFSLLSGHHLGKSCSLG